MKSLEDKILKKVYQLETRHTVGEVLVRIGIVALLLGTGIFASYIFINQLIEQQTLDVFQLFQEDISVIRDNIGDVLQTLYYEVPEGLLAFIIAIFILLIICVLIFAKNFGKIKRKIIAIWRFWTNH